MPKEKESSLYGALMSVINDPRFVPNEDSLKAFTSDQVSELIGWIGQCANESEFNKAPPAPEFFRDSLPKGHYLKSWRC